MWSLEETNIVAVQVIIKRFFLHQILQLFTEIKKNDIIVFNHVNTKWSPQHSKRKPLKVDFTDLSIHT